MYQIPPLRFMQAALQMEQVEPCLTLQLVSLSSGKYAYVTSQNSNALEVVDVSNPAVPVHAGSLTNGTGGALLSNPWGIYVSGHYAYIASLYSDALDIVDLGFVPANGVNVINPTKITWVF